MSARFAGTQHHSDYETPFRIQNRLSGVNTPLISHEVTKTDEYSNSPKLWDDESFAGPARRVQFPAGVNSGNCAYSKRAQGVNAG
jgi:hypothetical protein